MKSQGLEGLKMLCANWEGVRVQWAPWWHTPGGREAAGSHHTWTWDAHWVVSDRVKKATTKEKGEKAMKH